MRMHAPFLASSLTLGLSLAPSLRADTLVVDATGAGAFLRVQDAIDAAVDGDVIRIRPGVYAERLALGGKSIAFEGDGAPAEVVLASPDGATMLEVSAGQGPELRFAGLTWTGGSSGRLIRVVAAGPIFERCVFRDNQRGALDVAQACSSASTAVFDRCVFLDNSEPNGGAVYLFHTNCQFVDCDFVGNRAVGPTSGVNAGGAVYVNDWTCGTHTYAFTRCNFAGNSAVWGGAIYSQGIFRNATTQMPVVDCDFRGNAATQGKSMWNWYITAPVSGSWFCGGGDQIRNFWTNAGGNDFGGDCTAPRTSDCDGDGIRDALASLLGLVPDCDSDAVPDACEIAAGMATDANGDGVPDACDGILEVPGEFATVQEAVDVAVDGDVVLVGPGTHLPFDMRGKRIEVRSAAGREATVIDGTLCCGSAVKFGVGSGLATRLAGFTLRAGMGTGSSWLANGGCVYIESGNGTIEDCDFVGSVYGCGYGGGLRATSGSIVVRRCRFLGTRAIHDGGALQINLEESLEAESIDGEDPSVRGVIEDCVAAGCYAYNAGGFAVSVLDDTPEFVRIAVRRCLLSGNTGEYGPSSSFPSDMRASGQVFGPASHEILVERCVFASGSLCFSTGIPPQAPTDLRTRIVGSVFAVGGVRRNVGELRIGDSFFCAGSVAVTGGFLDLGGNAALCPTAEDCDEDGTPDFHEIVVGREEDADGDFRLDDCGVLRVPEDFSTVQAAVDSVPPGASARVVVAPGLYAESFSLGGKDVVVEAMVGGAAVFTGGPDGGSVVTFPGGEPATAGIVGLVIRDREGGTLVGGDRVGAAIHAVDSAAFVRDCRIENCRSDVGGAASFLRSSVLIEGSEFLGNAASINGGAIAILHSTGAVVDCVIEENRCGVAGLGSGSAAIVEQVPSGGALVFSGVRMAANAGMLSAAAFEYAATGEAGVVRIEDSVIELNEASASDLLTGVAAGGIRAYAPASRLVLAGSTRICANSPRNIDGPFLLEGTAEVCDLLSDLVPDGIVDGNDLAVVLGAWGTMAEDGTGDVNHDGVVDGADLALLLGSWGLVTGSN